MLEPGTLLQDRYRVVRHIGQGGMGAVYEAVDLRLGITVALKQTLLAGERMSRAFEREARLLAGLRHQALPRVIDHFTDALGQFLVMEFIPGDDLALLLTKRGAPFPLDDLLRWGDQLLDALDYLHTQPQPIIHRDIKPQNLKLLARGDIILLDFGLAKGLAPLQPQATTSSVFGYTPQYAPLEQIQGTGTNLRSDLYALAATLYHLLTGVPPTDALTRAAVTVDRQPDPLRPAHEIDPAVPPAISAVLVQGLALGPGERPSSAAEMRAALQAARRAGATEVDWSVPTVVTRRPDPALANAPTHPNRPPGVGAPRPIPAPPPTPAPTPQPGQLRRLWPTIVLAMLLLALLGALALDRAGLLSGSPALVAPTAVAVIPTAAPPTIPPSVSPTPVAPTSIPLVVGQQVLTKKPDARALMTEPTGGKKVVDRPRLFGGALVTILAIQPAAVQVWTPEGVEGWIQQPAADALTSDLTAIGEQAPFVVGARIQIVRANGIPLRQEPSPSAAKLVEQIKGGQQATVQEARGDWLRVTLDDGVTGWARWYYDGEHYMDAVAGQAARPSFTRTLSVETPRLSGDDVTAVQRRLVELGYSEVGEVDGLFGPNTESAIKRFQAANGLTVDGAVGPKTWEKLFGDNAR
jgi:serine/threonine protein kinase